LLDAFVALEEEDKASSLVPDHEILRIVEGRSGSVKMKMEFATTIKYGKYRPKLTNHKKLGIQFFYREGTYVLQSNAAKLQLEETTGNAAAEFILHAGEKITFSLSYSSQSPAIIPEIQLTGCDRMLKSIQYWKNWSAKCNYNGFASEHVIRSALTLKLLTHAPSGAIIAAPTTSLPEEPGGARNWDYRYCWLRDASFTVRALMKLGFYDEVKIYMNWILHATRLTRPKLQVVYTVFGEAKIGERTCEWLSGYKDARPVRIGNAADRQFQLDVYGEVLDAVYAYSELVEKFDRDTKRFIIGLGQVICKYWDKPDEGIWEIRSAAVHHTQSKVLAWVGLDRLIRLCQKYQWKGSAIGRFEKTMHMIAAQIEQQGYNSLLQHYTRELNGDDLDASLLVLPLVNYCEADSPKMQATRRKIQQRLSRQSFLRRNAGINDGLRGEEGAFIVCNFWLVENLVKSGLLNEAIKIFNVTVQQASATGLLAEEIDPQTNELLGNYPQGFSHIGLINAAIAIDEAGRQTRRMVS
jgi:GH15 family glucan-1,4-alpha-glucosidase